MTAYHRRPRRAGEIDGTPEAARVRAARQAFLRYHAQCFWYLRADL